MTKAGRALISLQHADRTRLVTLFRNTHAVIKNNRPLRDYTWLCKLDRAKGVEVGTTYLNDKAALNFLRAIAVPEREKIVNTVNNDVKFFGFMMDGSTNISGDEQETIYIRTALKGKVMEQFLCIGTPNSTCAEDLKEFVINKFDTNGIIDKGKLVALGSDGASNMTSIKGGLAALLRRDINPEITNVHCFAHRLELAFRDVLKKNNLYDKLMSLLIGLYYFYIKQYKNKHGLLRSIEAVGDGLLPTKVTGTRWLAHLSRGIKTLLRTFKAYEAHLSTVSHSNAKAEGYLKMMISKALVCFTLFLQEVLDPLMRLSLKLQKPDTSIAQSLEWVQGCLDVLEELKSREISGLKEVMETGTYKGINLRGSATQSYITDIIEGLKASLQSRFDLNQPETYSVVKSTSILHLNNWPRYNSSEVQDFGEKEIETASKHFMKTLQKGNPDFTLEETLAEWRTMKRIMYRRHGEKLQTLNWEDIYDKEFPMVMVVADLLLCIPPTSVRCETTFSHMKLIKTSRRTMLSEATLNDLLLVKLQSDVVENYDPEKAIDVWLSQSSRRRKLNYKRADTRSVEKTQGVQKEGEDNRIILEVEDDGADPVEEDQELESDLLEDIVAYSLCCEEDEEDEFCEGYVSEKDNWNMICDFLREE